MATTPRKPAARKPAARKPATRKGTTKPAPPPAQPAGGDVFDQWLATGTVATRTTTLNSDHSLAAEYTALEAKLAQAEERAKRNPDAPMDDEDTVPLIIEQMEDLYRRWEAAKATWTVRALSLDEVEATFVAVPAPTLPHQPPEKAGAKARERFARAAERFVKENKEADRERKLYKLAIAVTHASTPVGDLDGVTVEQLRTMRDRPHGEYQIETLYTALLEAQDAELPIERPTSPGSSTSVPG